MSEQIKKIRMTTDRYVNSIAGIIRLAEGDVYNIGYIDTLKTTAVGSNILDTVAVDLLNDAHAEPANEEAPQSAQFYPTTDQAEV